MQTHLGPTLRRLSLHCRWPSLFPSAAFCAFTASLIRLETLEIPRDIIGGNFPLRFTASHHLKYCSTEYTAPQLELDAAVRPSHLRIRLDYTLPSLFSPALTYLSLLTHDVFPAFPYEMYTHLFSTCPNLVSLTLAGALPDVMRILKYPLPHIAFLVFSEIYKADEDFETEVLELDNGTWVVDTQAREMNWTVEEVQTWMDALMALPKSVRSVRVLDTYFANRLRVCVRAKWVDAGRLKECGFVVEDFEGECLTDMPQRTVLAEDGVTD
ncbi:hypothetical protein OF83DRAFT_808550 [Amylostereum chailletii]|nr:hypothetical protein OF83DRAFT_808550 [Amylostereum chailletii]